MRVDGLFLMNEGPERKCIPVSALRGSSWLFGEFMSDVGVLHSCSAQENKIKRMTESKRRRRKRKSAEEKNINNKIWGPGGCRAEKTAVKMLPTPPQTAPPVNRSPGQRRN